MKQGLLSLLLLLCLVPACGDGTGEDGTELGGALAVDWAVKGGRRELDCNAAGASYILVEVKSLRNDYRSEFSGSCNLFSTTMSLTPDEYEGQAALFDGSTQLTRVVELGPFTVLEGQVTSTSIDFTPSVFR
jgi:hypothetical protein